MEPSIVGKLPTMQVATQQDLQMCYTLCCTYNVIHAINLQIRETHSGTVIIVVMMHDWDSLTA